MSLSHWLLKSEPHVYSIDDLARDRRTAWDGVRNYAGRNHMRAMKKGDLAFFYHSNASPSAIVAIVEVVEEAYPDATAWERKDEMHRDPKSTPDRPIWWMVDVRFRKKLTNPVALEAVKDERSLARMALVRIPRLSVQPVTSKEWATVIAMSQRARPTGRLK